MSDEIAQLCRERGGGVLGGGSGGRVQRHASPGKLKISLSAAMLISINWKHQIS